MRLRPWLAGLAIVAISTRVIRHRMISPVTIETHMRAVSKSPYPSDGNRVASEIAG